MDQACFTRGRCKHTCIKPKLFATFIPITNSTTTIATCDQAVLFSVYPGRVKATSSGRGIHIYFAFRWFPSIDAVEFELICHSHSHSSSLHLERKKYAFLMRFTGFDAILPSLLSHTYTSISYFFRQDAITTILFSIIYIPATSARNFWWLYFEI